MPPTLADSFLAHLQASAPVPPKIPILFLLRLSSIIPANPGLGVEPIGFFILLRLLLLLWLLRLLPVHLSPSPLGSNRRIFRLISNSDSVLAWFLFFVLLPHRHIDLFLTEYF